MPEEKLTYQKARVLWSVLKREQQIDQNDIWRWHFTEGDDTEARSRIHEKYPKLFSTLEAIREKVKDAKNFEEYTDDQMKELEALVIEQSKV